MAFYSDPPPLQTEQQDKPTLLVCWWITLFCTAIILLRVAGRFIRSEKLFREDKTAALAIIPLYARMAFVHIILVYGTNNAQFTELTYEEVRRRSIGSGLVLVSRMFHTATLWILKSAVLEFFKRLTLVTWKRSHELTLFIIRCTLVVTFVVILIVDLAECQPFENYWQVLPDPGPRCRQGYAQLVTFASSNILTDLLLVFFPVPIVLTSSMNLKRKIQLTALFSMSLGVVVATVYRVRHVVDAQGSQQTRSLLASVELLFATTAANALVLGSFVRDRGVKKQKFQHGSIAADSLDRASDRRPTMHRPMDSDEDLFRSLGIGMTRELRDAAAEEQPFRYLPAPVADLNTWQFPPRTRSQSDDSLINRDALASSRSNSTTTPRRVSFFDVGGLLESETSSRSFRESFTSSLDPLSPRGGPSPTRNASSSGLRRGSQLILQDLGGLLSPFQSRPSRSASRGGTELQPIPQHSREPSYESHDTHDTHGGSPALLDAGGLLR